MRRDWKREILLLPVVAVLILAVYQYADYQAREEFNRQLSGPAPCPGYPAAAELRLPANPSPAAYREYIDAVLACYLPVQGFLAYDRSSISFVLARVGRENVSLLEDARKRYPEFAMEVDAAIDELTGSERIRSIFSQRHVYAATVAEDSSAGISLPPAPTTAEYRRYIRHITERGRKRSHYSSDDPEIGWLVAVGHERLGLLLEALVTTYAQENTHLLLAIDSLATDSDQQQIIAALPRCFQLIDLIRARHWERAAAPVVLRVFRSRMNDVSPEWALAVATLQDTSTFPLLQRYLIAEYEIADEGRSVGYSNRLTTAYRAMRRAGCPTENAVSAAWRLARAKWQAQPEDAILYQDIALLAIQEGNVDAIEYYLSSMDENTEIINHVGVRLKGRDILKLFLDYRGDDAQLREWYTAHRATLRYDRQLQRYVAR